MMMLYCINRSCQISRHLRSSDTPLLHKPIPELTLPTMLSVALLLQYEIPLATTLSLALHLLYLSLLLRHSYSVRHLGLVGSHYCNLSISASGVFDILALYKLDYYYYYYRNLNYEVKEKLPYFKLKALLLSRGM